MFQSALVRMVRVVLKETEKQAVHSVLGASEYWEKSLPESCRTFLKLSSICSKSWISSPATSPIVAG
jgi:hypothetical protein